MRRGSALLGDSTADPLGQGHEGRRVVAGVDVRESRQLGEHRADGTRQFVVVHGQVLQALQGLELGRQGARQDWSGHRRGEDGVHEAT